MLSTLENSLTALESFSEALTAAQNILLKRPLERGLRSEMAAVFSAQGKEVIKALTPLASRFDANSVRESITQADWIHLVNNVIHGHDTDLTAVFSDYHKQTMARAATAQFGEFGINIIFGQGDPRSIAYAEQYAASRVTGISDYTIRQMNTIITNAVSNGHSWQRLSGDIENRFKGFTEGRSNRIARFEIGDSYEAGSRAAIDQMVNMGMRFTKKWSTAGDDNVRPEHTRNQGKGYIALTDNFPSGHPHPPTDGGCRCTLLYKRDKEKESRERYTSPGELEQIFGPTETPTDFIRPPTGRAPTGLGPEYQARRSIADAIDKNMRFQSENQFWLDNNFRGQRSLQRRASIAKERVSALRQANTASLEVAAGPGEWEFKQELINGIYEYSSVIAPGR